MDVNDRIYCKLFAFITESFNEYSDSSKVMLLMLYRDGESDITTPRKVTV